MKRRVIVVTIAAILAMSLTIPLALAKGHHGKAHHHEKAHKSASTMNANQAGGGDQSTNGNQNPGVLPPQTGKYAPLSAKWWQWAFSIVPKDQNPLVHTTDDTGKLCAEGQSGNIWFLGGSIGAVDKPHTDFTVDRKCNVPAGKQLFIPIVNLEGSTVEGNGNTPEELAQYAKANMDFALQTSSGIFASIDGVPLKNLDPKNTPYRVASGPFTFTLPPDSIDTFCGPNFDQQCPAVKDTNAAADGVYLLLAPLPKGQHEITFGGKFFVGTGFEFDENNRYIITVG